MKEKEKIQKGLSQEECFSAENKAEALAEFSNAMLEEDVDGFVFGVSLKRGLCLGATGNRRILSMLIGSIANHASLSEYDIKKGQLIGWLLELARKMGKEEEND